jgi:CheY-like chemotaxis protein
MIVDDNAFNLVALRVLLHKAKKNLTIFEATNGKMAIDMLLEH